MKSKVIKFISTILSLIIIFAFFVGCDFNNKETSTDSQQDNTDVVLRYWTQLHNNAAATVKNLGETPYAQELERQIGIKVQYIHPAKGQEIEQFNLLLASGDLPDIVYNYWGDFPGGQIRAAQEGYILELNDLIDKNAPNFKEYLKSNPDIDKMVKTDDGKYYLFPFIRGDEYLLVSSGPIMRKDWLDELNLEVPTTIDEWEETLTMFKDKKGAESPLVITTGVLRSSMLMGAYGIISNFYHEDGVVKYGSIQQEYKDYLITMKNWYDNGLIDKNFPTVNNTIIDANILNGKSGATHASLGQGLGRYLIAGKEKDSNYNLVGVPYPVLKKGDKPKFVARTQKFNHQGAAITNNCKNEELAVQFLDYAYGEEGHMLNNFGIEGESYEMVDGYPKYTDVILNNPEGLSANYAMGRYLRASGNGPFVQDKRYYEQYLTFSQQKEALESWMNSDVTKYSIPPIVLSTEESAEKVKIMTEVETYESEMFLKFITGIEPIENFDNYLAKMKELGIDRAIQIQQAAFERYHNR